MVYDEDEMRSTLAMLLAALMVAVHAPEFLATGSGQSRTSRAGAACCSTPACCMHRGACHVHGVCGASSASTSVRNQENESWICVGACADESPRMTPGTPDPGTLEPPVALPADFAAGV